MLTVLLLTVCPLFSLAQDGIYWPEHEGMWGARWSPDGNYIATWGESPLVRIWNDHDGSLALELDHSALAFELPNGEARLNTDSFSIRGVTWSEDLRHIMTYAQPESYWLNFFLVVWKADTGEYVYAHSWGIQYYYTRDYLVGHEVVQENVVAAVWYRDAMSFIDINPASASVGKELAKIQFGELATFWEVLWNDQRGEALLKLRNDWKDPCENCEVFFKLYDTNMNSESFGEFLWQREVFEDSRSFVWPNEHDLLALQVDDRMELWNLDRDSAQFGTMLLDISREGSAFHTALYDDVSSRFVIAEVEVVRGDERSETRIPFLCLRNDCEFKIIVLDLDEKSPTYGRPAREIRQTYKIILAHDGVAEDFNRVNLNLSKTQIHVRSAEKIPDTWGDIEFIYTAYDLVTGDVVEPKDIISRSRRRYPFAHDYPRIDFDHGFDEWFWSTNVKDVHPSGSKIIVHMTSNDASGDPGWWYIRNIDTGEFFYPPDTWREQWGEG
ncbi:MAG: hypothetical protein F4X02_08290 [Chloroflexi bacterium]|nr:hypothetical protein [Chloroflexota bacterium]